MRRICYVVALLGALSWGCDFNSDDYELGGGYQKEDVIRQLAVDPASRSIPADGVSSFEVTATIPAKAETGKRTVTFTTTEGGFAPEGKKTVEVEADADGNAVATLISTSLLRRSRDAIEATIEASIGGVTRDERVTFERALPDEITLEADVFSLAVSPSATTTLTARLHREKGRPSTETPVVFSAHDSDGNPIGSFRNTIVLSDTGGTSATVFHPGDVDYRGPIRFSASVEGVEKPGEFRIQLIDP